MADKSRRKPPLVADRRFPGTPREVTPPKGTKSKAPPKPGTQKKTTARKPAKPRRPVRKRKGIGGFFGAVFGWFARLIWRLVWRLTTVVVILVALAVGYVLSTLPEVDTLMDARARGSVTMLDQEGEVFAWRGDQFGGVITAQSVSPNLRNAIIATEDKRFYGHFGLSPRGIASAVRINLREGRGPLSGNGGSTITQQTAKLLCLGVVYDREKWKSAKVYEDD